MMGTMKFQRFTSTVECHATHGLFVSKLRSLAERRHTVVCTDKISTGLAVFVMIIFFKRRSLSR